MSGASPRPLPAVRKRKLVHVPRKRHRVGPHEECHWIKHHGDTPIVKAYAADGCLWLVAEKDRHDPSDARYGLVKRANAEWGVVDVDWLEQMARSGDVDEAFVQSLPCTLRELFESTVAWTYFVD